MPTPAGIKLFYNSKCPVSFLSTRNNKLQIFCHI